MKRIISFILSLLIIISATPTLNFTVLAVKTQALIDGVDVGVLQDKLEDAAENFQKTVDISSLKIKFSQTNAQKIDEIFYNIIDENPTFFHLKDYSIAYLEGGDITTVTFNYKHTKTQYFSMMSEVEKIADTLIHDIKGKTLSDLEKALLVHDRIAVLCEYDYESYEKFQNGDKNALPYNIFNICGVLIDNIAVCEGYAYTYKYLMEKLGIKTEVCKSDTLGHMWNVVEIDGEKYHVDVTYDDPVYDVTGKVNHNFFMLSTSAIKKNGHNANDFTNKEPDSTKYDNYFWQDVNTQFCYLDGKLYYIDNSEASIYSYHKNARTKITSVYDKWYKTDTIYYIGNFSKLSSDGERLYYNLSDAIYSYNVDTKVKTKVYEPDLSGYNHFSIFGFKAYNCNFYYDLYNSNVYKSNTKRLFSKVYNYSHDLKYAYISGIKDKTYTGKPITQTIVVNLGNKTLTYGTEYTCVYSNNKYTGKATLKIVGLGKYKGSITKTFYIEPKKITGVSTSASGKTVTVKWTKTPSASGYIVKRATSKSGAYKTVATLKSKTINNFKDKSTSYNKTYYYKVIAYKTVDGKKVYGTYSSKCSQKTSTKATEITSAKRTSKNKAKVKWSKKSGASGYKVYISTKKTKGFKCVYTGKGTYKTIKGLKSNKTYYVKVRTYKTYKGKKIYSPYSSTKKIKK